MPGLLVHTPSDILARILVDLGLGEEPAEGAVWPIGISVEPDSPDNVITVYDTVGTTQGRTHVDGEIQEMHGIQVRVRSARHTAGATKAHAIARALDVDIYQTMLTVDAHLYCVHSIGRTSSVIPLGKESPQSKRVLFTINALMCIRMKS